MNPARSFSCDEHWLNKNCSLKSIFRIIFSVRFSTKSYVGGPLTEALTNGHWLWRPDRLVQVHSMDHRFLRQTWNLYFELLFPRPVDFSFLFIKNHMAGKLDRINKIHKVIHCDRRSRFSYYRRKNIVNSNRDFEVFRFGTDRGPICRPSRCGPTVNTWLVKFQNSDQNAVNLAQ